MSFEQLLIDQANLLCDRTLRAGAVLRLLQFRFNNTAGVDEQMEMADIEAVVGLTLEVLPHHYDDVLNPIDAARVEAHGAIKQRANECATLSSLLDAMTIAAQPKATCKELDEAARVVYSIAKANAGYEPRWRSFCETVKARGYIVEIMKMGGIGLGPSVMTAEMIRQRRKVERRMGSSVAAGREQEAVRREPVRPRASGGKPRKGESHAA